MRVLRLAHHVEMLVHGAHRDGVAVLSLEDLPLTEFAWRLRVDVDVHPLASALVVLRFARELHTDGFAGEPCGYIIGVREQARVTVSRDSLREMIDKMCSVIDYYPVKAATNA